MKKFTLFIFIFTAEFLLANITLPQFFSDNMVLQRDAKIPVWGFAKPNEKVTIHFKNQTESTVANQNGDWKIELNPEKFGGPFEMKISGENQVVLKNILIGDVWICSGQSNMEWNLGLSEGFENEKNQKKFPLIRHIKFSHQVNTIPQKDISKTEWKVADASTIGDFSGVAYFFAKKMVQETKIPVGLLNISWGGTNIETWIPRDGFESSEDFKQMISKMPKIAGDDFMNQIFQAKTKEFEQKLKSKIADFKVSDFQNLDADENQWFDIPVNDVWEQQGFEFDGVAWYRKTINLTENDVKSDATLSLGMIDDNDVTYFNGIKVGGINQFDAKRVYKIPQNLLKIVRNIITIQVTDTGGGGGFFGTDEKKLETSVNNISLSENWKFAIEKIDKSFHENNYPTLAYNGMIAPVIPFAIKGFLWYQGESNCDRATEYQKSFPLLINSWREKFGKNLPFYFVQLATFNTNGNSNQGCDWCELREAQTSVLNVKNTGMAVTTDVGNPKDIHPRNKKSVGERLANLALNNGNVSPRFKDYKFEKNKIIVSFSPNLKLKTTNKNGEIKGFEIAGNDQNFYPAKAKLVNNTIIVSCENVEKPVAVRFGWKSDDTECNLFTDKGLPVSPFRTDDFKTVTKDKKYKFIIE